MPSLVRKLSTLECLGVAQKVVQLGVNGGLVLAAAFFLDAKVKGLYFTFVAICGASTLFEMGYCYTLVQKIAHFSSNSLGAKRKRLAVYYKSVKRMIDFSCWYLLLVVAMAWYALILPEVLVAEELIIPIFVTTVSFLFRSVSQVHEAYLEGNGRIKIVLLGRTISCLIGGIASLFFLKDAPMAAPGVFVGAMGLASLLFHKVIAERSYNVAGDFRLLKKLAVSENIKSDAYSRKIAFSWISGYLIYQFLPILEMRFNGPASAGVFGLLNAISVALLGVSGSVVSVNNFKITSLYATGATEKLIRFELRRLSMYTGMVTLLCATLLFIGIWFLDAAMNLQTANLPVAAVLIVIVGTASATQVSVAATFLRARLNDPLFLPSYVQALCTVLLALMLAPAIPLYGVLIAYTAPILLIALPSAFFLVRNRLMDNVTPPTRL